MKKLTALTAALVLALSAGALFAGEEAKDEAKPAIVKGEDGKSYIVDKDGKKVEVDPETGKPVVKAEEKAE